MFTAMRLSTSQLQLLRKILVFYSHHHMSERNPQKRDIDAILDKISEGIHD